MEWNGTFLSAAGQSLLSLCRGGKIADCGLPGLFNSSLSGKESVFRCERFERFVPDFFFKKCFVLFDFPASCPDKITAASIKEG
jgi:hypothetical protein